ncbi:MAG: L-threonylcarbamoyladenylate synthase [Ginsengibacter sp.]
METFEDDIIKSIEAFKSHGIILYPTDTIWGIGCRATDAIAIKKIYALKKRDGEKSMIILVADASEICRYVSQPSKKLIDVIETSIQPVTGIFEQGINLPHTLINEDGTIAIRIVKDDFCISLIRESGVPIVSTSANVSGKNYPHNFYDVSDEIKSGVDYIVQHRRDDLNTYNPSSIIKLNLAGEIQLIR